MYYKLGNTDKVVGRYKLFLCGRSDGGFAQQSRNGVDSGAREWLEGRRGVEAAGVVAGEQERWWTGGGGGREELRF
ncbi:hypothetical protein TSUD_328150 [Trifolium subterraneum]|uniref:Uncharacterized protein n=1 Tax=Trifolium subterraneum TaxID=3900 RepID=A0A2Z6M1S1_TRISU|nr:hypothetical protein TSUD_328150 [Trifolium subterraneum]